MSTKTAGYLALYGALLIGLGLLGYLSNEEAKSASLIAVAFGTLAILWGVLGACGIRCSLSAAIMSTGLLALVCAWQAAWGWLALLDGRSERLTAVGLTTTSLVSSALMLPFLLKAR